MMKIPDGVAMNCPFCNGHDLTLSENHIPYKGVSVMCKDCRADGPIKTRLDGGLAAIRAWNNRVGQLLVRVAEQKETPQ